MVGEVRALEEASAAGKTSRQQRAGDKITTSAFRARNPEAERKFGLIYPPDDGWLARQTAEAVLLPDIPIIDSHQHFWHVPGNEYILEDYVADIASGHSLTASVYVECESAYRPSGPRDLRPVGETEYVVSITKPYQDGPFAPAAGIVGFVDLTLGAGVETCLAEHVTHGDGRFRGVRFCTGFDGSDEILGSRHASRPDMFAHPAVREGAGKLAELGLTLDVWLFFTQLPDVAALADAVPELQIVLNHCGGPLGYGPYSTDPAGYFAIWEENVRELALRPNVVCKLGGILNRAAAYDYFHSPKPADSTELAQAWAPWFVTCIDAFGSHRCLFESNFPVEKMGTSYVTLWNAYKRVAHGASPAELKALFAGNAQRVYRLGDKAPMSDLAPKGVQHGKYRY